MKCIKDSICYCSEVAKVTKNLLGDVGEWRTVWYSLYMETYNVIRNNVESNVRTFCKKKIK